MLDTPAAPDKLPPPSFAFSLFILSAVRLIHSQLHQVRQGNAEQLDELRWRAKGAIATAYELGLLTLAGAEHFDERLVKAHEARRAEVGPADPPAPHWVLQAPLTARIVLEQQTQQQLERDITRIQQAATVPDLVRAHAETVARRNLAYDLGLLNSAAACELADQANANLARRLHDLMPPMAVAELHGPGEACETASPVQSAPAPMVAAGAVRAHAQVKVPAANPMVTGVVLGSKATSKRLRFVWRNPPGHWRCEEGGAYTPALNGAYYYSSVDAPGARCTTEEFGFQISANSSHLVDGDFVEIDIEPAPTSAQGGGK